VTPHDNDPTPDDELASGQLTQILIEVTIKGESVPAGARLRRTR
jgi:hypothetical protein